jgi:hypothetical protein
MLRKDLGPHVLTASNYSQLISVFKYLGEMCEINQTGAWVGSIMSRSSVNGTDLRRDPIEVRKATLASILRNARHGVRLNEHLEHDCGLTVFQHGKMGLEGIVSKRLGSRYRSGRSPDWLKFKNPEAPAVKREAEEDWSR